MKLTICTLLIMFSSLAVAQVTVENDPKLDNRVDLAERTSFDSINFSIQPPLHYMKQDTGFFGFMNPAIGSALAIIKIPYRSFENVGEEYQHGNFEAAGSRLISGERLMTDKGVNGYLYRVHFSIQGTIVERIVYFVGTQKTTYMIYANYPLALGPVLLPVFKSSLATIQFEE